MVAFVLQTLPSFGSSSQLGGTFSSQDPAACVSQYQPDMPYCRPRCPSLWISFRADYKNEQRLALSPVEVVPSASSYHNIRPPDCQRRNTTKKSMYFCLDVEVIRRCPGCRVFRDHNLGERLLRNREAVELANQWIYVVSTSLFISHMISTDDGISGVALH
jgi:hypothetical protein